MSELRDFVSEFDVEAERKRRQEEWERVRRPDQPLEAPEPEIDHRPLYVRLKEQRDKAQLEFEQTMKMQRTVQGIDEDELEFFQQIDRKRDEVERTIRTEEEALIAAIHKEIAASASGRSVNNVSVAPKSQMPDAGTRPKKSRQAQLLANAVRKKTDKQARSNSSNASTMKPDGTNPRKRCHDATDAHP